MDFPFSFTQKSSILLIFFFNGIVFSSVLLRKGIISQNSKSKWLSFLLFLGALYIAPYMLGYAGWYSRQVTREIVFFIPFMQVLFIGPVLYFYIKSLLFSDFRFTKKDWWHFLPGILYLGYSLIVFITDKFIVDEFYFYADGRDKDLKTWYQLTGLLSISTYLILSLQNYLRYKKAIFETLSFADTVLFQWIQNFLISFLLLIFLRILFFIVNPQWAEFGNQFWYYLCFSLVFFYIAFNGYALDIKTSFFVFENVEEPTENDDEKIIQSTIDVDFWKSKIETIINEKQLYKNSKLTLIDVANQLETTTKIVSTAINSGYNKNFNDFINEYRVEAFKEKINQDQHHKNTLLGLALDCGFNSKATFNRAFKKATSLTPNQYIKDKK